jgi:hypothetical protein
MIEARFQPREGVDGRAQQSLRTALGEGAARHLDILDHELIASQDHEECAIAGSGLAQ